MGHHSRLLLLRRFEKLLRTTNISLDAALGLTTQILDNSPTEQLVFDFESDPDNKFNKEMDEFEDCVKVLLEEFKTITRKK